MLRTLLRPTRLAALLCLLLLTTCGLEKIPYLSPPAPGGLSGSAFSFTRLAENSESGINYQFQGFELYYRFYTTSAEVNTNIASQSELTAAGFRRVCGAFPDEMYNSIDKPLIAVGVAGELDFTLNFAVTPEPTASSNPPGITAVMRRSAHYGSSHPQYADQFKSFAYDFTTTDPYAENDQDVDPAIWGVIATPGSNVYLALYVLSYGRQDFVTDLYSEARYLGNISINFGW